MSRTPRSGLLAALATLLLVMAFAAPTQAAPVLPAFYTPPSPLPAGTPGEVIRTEAVSVSGLHGSLLRVMYHSRSIKGADIAVTGYIAIPSTPPPAGGYPVVSWAHGTTGIADECAPSLDGNDATSFNALLDEGWLVVATDYEGLGTPGRHPYIVGDSEARGVIDIVRAARNVPAAHASTDYVVWGHSQGGHAAMFSLHIADSWAPELHLKGVVAGAPPSQLNLVYDYLVNSPYRYYLLMVGAAINAAYGDTDAPLGDILNANGIKKIALVDQGCTGFLGQQTDGVSVQDLMLKQADGTFNPYSNPVWGPLIKAQDPQNFTSPASEPLLIIHGGADEQIPTVSSELLAGQLCATGQQVQRWVYPGQSHAGVIAPSFADMTAWMAARFAGDPDPTAVQPVASADVPVDTSVCADGKMVATGPTDETSTTTSSPSSTVPDVVPATPSDAVPAYAVSGSPTFTG